MRQFFSSALCLRARRFTAYLPADAEIDPTPLLRRLTAIGKTVQLPRVIDDWRGTRMVFQNFRFGDPLALNRYHIPQPIGPYPRHSQALTVVLAPLVAFDSDGYRLGMGGGFYDRYLARHPRSLYIGLAHDIQQSSQALPREPWDRPLDAVVTQRQWHHFSHRARILLQN